MKRIMLAAACACICWSAAPAQEKIVPADALAYRSNAVCEIGTGTWCGWCIRGIAATSYYLEAFPGTEQMGRFIPIAVHVGDQMSQTEYGMGLALANYPAMRVNRVGNACDPNHSGIVGSTIKNGSNWMAEVTAVEAQGSQIEVRYEVRCGYDNPGAAIRYAVVLTANDIGPFLQANNYNNASMFQRKELAQWLEPYVAPFYQAGSKVEMEYDYVAQGIWPCYEGELLAFDDWKRDEPCQFAATIPVQPGLDLGKCSVVVMAIDDATGQIVASDMRQAKSEGDLAPAIEGELPFTLRGDELVISPQAAYAAVCCIDGRMAYAGAPAAVRLARGRVYLVSVDGKPYRVAVP